MKWVIIVVRTLVGLGFTITGLDGFVHFIPPQPMPGGDAGAFGEVLVRSHYMGVVKACELIGGLLLLSGRMAPLGITLLMPVAVNIFLFEAFLQHEPGPGHVLVLLLVLLIWGYRRYFAPIFTTRAQIGA